MMVYYGCTHCRGGQQTAMAARGVVLVLLALFWPCAPSWAEDLPTGSPAPLAPATPDVSPQETNPASAPLSASAKSQTEGLREDARLHPNDAAAHYQLALGLLTPPSGDAAQPVLAPAPSASLLEPIQALRTTIRLKPEWIEPRLLLGETLFRAGDLDGALSEYTRVVHLRRPEPRAHLGLAKGLIAKQDWPAAQVALKEALREDPTLTEARYLLGSVLYSQGRLRASIDAYRKTLWLKPEFADAHHRLGLLLKLVNREQEAIEEFRLAAQGGVPEAQYFLGQAYRIGRGIAPDLVQAIHWWVRATELGHGQALAALKQLRRAARASNSPKTSKQAADILKAFSDYRLFVWQEFPDLSHSPEVESVGLTLLNLGRDAEALPVLIREAWALSESAQARLEEVYEQGTPGGMPAFDQRILMYLEQCSTEDLPASRVTLARIYFRGLGVPKDDWKVKSLLKSLPKAERAGVWESLSSEEPPR